jgi:hypothetical protein
MARVSKTVDPEEPDRVSESAMLHNDQAYALYRQHAPLYRQHAQNERNRQRKQSTARRTNIVEGRQPAREWRP